MIPVPAVLGAVRAYLPLLALIVGGIVLAFGVHRVQAWRDGFRRLEATETALERIRGELRVCTDSAAVVAQAAQDAAEMAHRQAVADKLTAERVSRELQTDLLAADRRSRDLADRLRDYQDRRCPGAVPAAAGAAGNAPDAAGEPAGGDGVAEATAALIGACARDSERLAGWIDWYGEVSAGRE